MPKTQKIKIIEDTVYELSQIRHDALTNGREILGDACEKSDFDGEVPLICNSPQNDERKSYLKNSETMEELKQENQYLRAALSKARTEIKAVNLFNGKVAIANRILRLTTDDESIRMECLNEIDKQKDIKGTKLVYIKYKAIIEKGLYATKPNKLLVDGPEINKHKNLLNRIGNNEIEDEVEEDFDIGDEIEDDDLI